MSYFSPTVENILANRKQKDNSKEIIQKLNKDLPVLSNIVDYGGQSTVDDILYMGQSERNQKNYNNFEKILHQASESGSQRSSKRYLSFIDYKAEPSKIKQAQKRQKSKRSLKTSIVVQMPQQLKSMKNQILSLPSIGHSRITPQKQISHTGSRLLDSLKKSQSRRFQTEISETSNKSQQKKNCLLSLRSILTQFESPALNCNNYILFRHNQCKKILEEQEQLGKQYKKFESFGSPPKRIIQLKKLLHSFESTMQNNMDSQIAHQISNMDSKRYDIVLKHQQEVRRLNVEKFRQKRKQEKLEQVKGDLSTKEGFKLNSKGNLIYLNKTKTQK